MIFGLDRIAKSQYREQCALHAYLLLERQSLPKRFEYGRQQCLVRINNVGPALSLDKSVLLDFHSNIQRGQQIDAEPFHALLSKPIQDNSSQHSKALECLTAVILICSSGVGMMPARIESALRQVRLLAQGLNAHVEEEVEVVKAIPSFINDELVWLEALHDLSQHPMGRFKNRFSPLHRLIEDYIEGEAKNIKTKGSGRERSEGEVVESSTSRKMPSSEDTNGITIHQFQKVRYSSSIDPVEHRADQQPTCQFIDIDLVEPEQVKKSLVLSAQRSKQIANFQLKASKKLVTNFSTLTPHELRISRERLYRGMESDEFIPSLIMLILATGQPIPTLVESSKAGKPLRTLRVKNGKCYFRRNLHLPGHSNELTAGLIRKSQSYLDLQIPKSFEACIRALKNFDGMEEDLLHQVNEYLVEINSSEGTHLTINKVSHYFKSWLIRRSADSAVIELFTGGDVIEHSSIYYTQFNNQIVLKTFSDYMESISLSDFNQALEGVELSPFGSNLFIKKSGVKALIEHYQQALKNKPNCKEGMLKYHNAFTAYTLFILNLSTGHRPVIDPYNTCKSFSSVTKTVHIQDKDVGGQDSGRVIALPAVAHAQYCLYLEHLEMLSKKAIAQCFRERCAEALTGNKAIFFMMNQDGCVRLTPSSLYREVEGYFPFKLNWHRHFMRSILSNHQVHAHIIDAWMGHSTFGNDTFASYSCVSMGDMKRLATVINEFLTDELGLVAVEGWN